MKNMSFKKIAIFFGVFLLVIAVGTVVLVKMKTSKNKQFVPMKTYSPEQTANAAGTPAPPPQSQPAPQPSQVAQAALQPAPQAPVAPAATGQADIPSFAKATGSPASTTVPTAQPAPNVPPTGVPGDIGAQLAGIDSKLSRFETRIAALEARSPSAATPASKSVKNPPAARVSHPRGTRKVIVARASANKPDANPQVREATGYKTMAVVGNRAWVALPDGREVSVTPGDTIPQPRPRVRSIDRDTGVVIMSSDEQINAH